MVARIASLHHVRLLQASISGCLCSLVMAVANNNTTNSAAPIPDVVESLPSLALPVVPLDPYRDELFSTANRRVVVTNQAMGARCAVAADFDGDGRMDLVSASSNDNAVSWFRNEGPAEVDATGSTLNGGSVTGGGFPTFSIKRKITWSSLGSRIVTVADIDGDGDIDVIGASYYDSSLRWYENDGTGTFTPHLISTAVNEGQGVTVADVDNDGDVDIISASSGDDSIALFRNVDGKGSFCEIKEVVDDNAVGARTVIATDLNGDGWVDLVSASKDDDTVAWYPNDGTGKFPTKVIISKGQQSKGAYSLVSVDIDADGDDDLIVASNGNDSVTLWRNDGLGNFTRTLIHDGADFVLSVTAVDFDRDGDIDVASASFFDGHINWYENVDGLGTEWRNRTVYVGVQGHYVSAADMDGDGDDDLIAVTHAENTVAIFLARTGCDASLDFDGAGAGGAVSRADGKASKRECCRLGTEWNGTSLSCEPCTFGEYGIGSGADAQCTACPRDVCTIPGHNVLPVTCSGTTGCSDIAANIAACSCHVDAVRDTATNACVVCPEGQVRPQNPDYTLRGLDTLGNYSRWEMQQGVCVIERAENSTNNATLIGVIVALLIIAIVALVAMGRMKKNAHDADDVWRVHPSELKFNDPPQVLGRGTFGLVVLAEYRGTEVAVKRVIPPKASITDSELSLRISPVSTNPSSQISSSCSCLWWRSADSEGVTDLHQRSSDGSAGFSNSLFDNPVISNLLLGDNVGADAESSAAESDADAGKKTMSLGLLVPIQTGNGKTRSSNKTGLLSGMIKAYSNENGIDCGEATRNRLRQDFLMEMRHLSKLRHPCITTVMGAVIETNSDPALVMEYMDRGSLHSLLHNETVSLDGDLLLPILQDICQGLRFLHSADPQVLHGDLKAANILIDSKSRAKVADFGLTQKKEMAFTGTPFWMAPELLRGESENTSASDIYSFGMILYEVYSRRDPYEDESFRKVITQICDPKINKRPPVPPACPLTVGVIMKECLDGEPTARPSFEELDLRLKRERVENVEPGDMHLTVQTKKRERASQRAENLMYEIFPRHIADALREGRKVEPEHHDCVTVFFSDIVGFTTISQEIGHRKVALMLERLYNRFDDLLTRHDVFKIEVVGDAYLAVTNLVKDQKKDHVKRMADFSIDAIKAAGEVLQDEDDPSRGGVQIRVGFHSGPVIADVLGTRLPKYSIFGDTVNTASRMECSSRPGRIHCSLTSAHLLTNQAPTFPQVSRGKIKVKGKGEMHTFWINEKVHEEREGD